VLATAAAAPESGRSSTPRDEVTGSASVVDVGISDGVVVGVSSSLIAEVEAVKSATAGSAAGAKVDSVLFFPLPLGAAGVLTDAAEGTAGFPLAEAT
jgi:hypothetical protein